MSAKPVDLPPIRLQPQKPQPLPTNATTGPSFSDAFSQFLQGHTRVPSSSLPASQTASTLPKPQTDSTNVSAKVIVQAVPQAYQKPAEQKVSEVQQKQEDWTSQVLKQSQQQPLQQRVATERIPQSQQQPLQQRVTTERIQPYVSGQTPVYAIQQNVSNDNASQVYYTIRNAPNQSLQQRMKVNGQGYEHQQPFY